jgi:hypothetical protein
VRDLRGDFQADRVDQSELEQLLQTHFGGSSSSTIEEVQYARQGQPHALTLRYDDDGELACIEPGAGLTTDDVPQIVDKIQRFLLQPAEAAIGQAVLFSGLPMSGYFRYRDVFQLVPVPPEAPKPPFTMAQHPLLLQFRFPGTPDAMIKILRGAQVGRDLELLCAALTFTIHGDTGNTTRHHWCVVGALDNPASLRSEYCQEGTD